MSYCELDAEQSTRRVYAIAPIFFFFFFLPLACYCRKYFKYTSRDDRVDDGAVLALCTERNNPRAPGERHDQSPERLLHFEVSLLIGNAKDETKKKSIRLTARSTIIVVVRDILVDTVSQTTHSHMTYDGMKT